MRDLDFVWKALADPHRRRMLQVLRDGPKSAGELARSVGLASNAASFHLRCLLAASLVAVERRGRTLSYRLERYRLGAWLNETEKLAGTSSDTAHGEAKPVPAQASSQASRRKKTDATLRSSRARRETNKASPNQESNATGPIPDDTLPTELL